MKKVRKFFPALVVLSWLYVAFSMLQPVEIVAVHQNHILVRHFPLTDKGKIDWWKKNAALLKTRYAIDPKAATVNIWDFRDGYQTEKPDENSFFPDKDTSYLLCFKEIKEAERCIKKENILLYLRSGADGATWYRGDKGAYYQKPNGPLLLEEN